MSESLKTKQKMCCDNNRCTTGGGREESRGNNNNTTPTPTKRVKTLTKVTYFTHDTTEELEEILMKDEFGIGNRPRTLVVARC